MAHRHSVARRDLSRGGNQAIALNLDRHIANSILQATVVLSPEDAAAGQIQKKQATDGFMRGVLADGEWYYLVESRKFTRRFYVVVKQSGRLVCSAPESRVAEECIARVQTAYPNALVLD